MQLLPCLFQPSTLHYKVTNLLTLEISNAYWDSAMLIVMRRRLRISEMSPCLRSPQAVSMSGFVAIPIETAKVNSQMLDEQQDNIIQILATVKGQYKWDYFAGNIIVPRAVFDEFLVFHVDGRLLQE
jgi:hypothetical protein